MSSYPGIRAAPMLGGTLLDGISPSAVGVRKREVKTIHETGRLARREFLPWQEEGYPLRLWKREFSLAYRSLRDRYDLVEELLAGPGPFDFVNWKVEHLVYQGDGVRSEFFLPWRVAIQIVSNPPTIDVPRLQPVVKVGIAGTELTYQEKDATAYAGTPTSGEAWFLEDDGQSFKLASAPAVGALVYCRVVPIYEVLEREEQEKRYTGPVLEPRDIVLVET